MYLYESPGNQSLGMGETLSQFHPNPDNMPTRPLPPGAVPPVPLPNNPMVPKKYCSELNKIQSHTCYLYAPHEIRTSRSAAGHLPLDVVFLQPGAAPANAAVSCGYLVIRDFGVDWRHVKLAARRETLFKDFLNRFETNKSLVFRIVGYSDCVGPELNNFLLRRGRARNVFKLLGKSARSRVLSVTAAPAHTYLTDNSTVPARANNRSVVIEFFTNGIQTA